MSTDNGYKIENVLIEALPYVQMLRDAKILIKIGGHAIIDRKIMESVVRDVVFLRCVGAKPIIVHGGGPEITHNMEKFGKKPVFIDGLRVTDDETLEIAEMVLVGRINTDIVRYIVKYGGKGVGLSGIDGLLISAKKIGKVLNEKDKKEVDLGLVGEIEKVNTEILEISINNGYIPVVSPIATDFHGNHFNINADNMAGEIAAEVKAKKLILLTNVPGVIKDDKVISDLSTEMVESLIKDKIVTGGMIPKLNASINAVRKGVDKAHILDGSRPHSLLLELFTDEGIGSMVHI
ncbi:acetylglutamate kinase [Candidatus Methanoliparum sp. LAM-1]|nr:acetylglutamate kinase [Candidatus Methanoliparum sp. LAM-1]BDC36442.1 acetylglutamate kinase [Candidatus Methanoliparum sp. LAM-1]